MSMFLEAGGLRVSYGQSQALFDVDLCVAEREVVTLLGRNGMGKSTTVHAVMGMLPLTGGSLSLAGKDCAGRPAHAMARAGLGLVPEGRQIFPNLSVEENLLATGRQGAGDHRAWDLRRIYGLFPRLLERRKNMGDELSGGEQQMLAIGRALMTNPLMLILDEATEGLAPLIRAEIWACLATLKKEGLALLVIDKNIAPLLSLADRHYVIDKGRTVWSGTSAQLAAQTDVISRYVTV